MTSKIPDRTADDIDETALSYGEIKALATGNKYILEKTQLDSEVAKLKIVRQSYQSQIYDLEDKIARSFIAKEEIVSIMLRDPNADVIIVDPEREESSLVKSLGGEVIKISATSGNHINAMDMNKDYGDGANPVILKSEFILSLCEQLIGSNNLGTKQKSIIDRCTASVYRYYQQGNYQGTPPRNTTNITRLL